MMQQFIDEIMAVCEKWKAEQTDQPVRKRKPKIYRSRKFLHDFYIADMNNQSDWLSNDGAWIPSCLPYIKKKNGCYFPTRARAEQVMNAWCGEMPEGVEIVKASSGWIVKRAKSDRLRWLWPDAEWHDSWSTMTVAKALETTYKSLAAAEHAYRTWAAREIVEDMQPPFEGEECRLVTEGPKIETIATGRVWVYRIAQGQYEYLHKNGEWGRGIEWFTTEQTARAALNKYWQSKDRPAK